MLETMIAAAVMLVGICGVMSLFTVATLKNQSQGSQATRCTEYAQDKLEQLMALTFSNAFTDTCSDTTQVPTVSPTTTPPSCPIAACTGATCVGLTNGGSTTTPPQTGYVDYVTEGSGTGAAVYSTKQSNSSYSRLWSIVPDGTGKIKTITVKVTALSNIDVAAAPSTTLSSQKTSF